MNSVNIIGNIVRDSEIRATRTGRAVITFAIANNERRGDVDNVNFFNVTYFAKDESHGSKMAGWLKQGKKIAISGRLVQSRWKTQNGDSRSRVEIIANTIDFCQQSEKPVEPEAVQPVQPMTGIVTESVDVNGSIYDVDIPF